MEEEVEEEEEEEEVDSNIFRASAEVEEQTCSGSSTAVCPSPAIFYIQILLITNT